MIASTTPEDQIGRVSAWFQAGNLAVGLSYSAFSAMALTAIGGSAAATGYNVFASLSNFPLWWLGGGLLGYLADHYGQNLCSSPKRP